jgi:hypothetical protein
MGCTDRGFDADANLFEMLARQAPEKDQADLLEVASAFRALAKTHLITGSRSNRWRMRAQGCRTLADHFKNDICNSHLSRLADAYDMLAEANEIQP